MAPPDYARLDQLAADAGVTTYTRKPPLTTKDLKAVPAVDAHSYAAARQLLANRRKANPGYKDPETKISRHLKRKSTISKAKDTTLWKYEQLELDSTLQDALNTGHSLPIIAALLQEGAHVNFQTTLPQAVNTWAAGLASVLLIHKHGQDVQTLLDALLVDASKGLNQMSRTQINDRHVQLVSTLIASGAKVPRIALEVVITKQHYPLLEILLRSSQAVPSADLSNSLCEVVKRNDPTALSMLLAYGADPNEDSAASVGHTIAGNSYKLATALFANPLRCRLSQQNLEKLTRTAIQQTCPSSHGKWLELLLGAGADPDTPDITGRLRDAVIADDYDLVLLLARAGTPVSDRRSNALKEAILKISVPMVLLLLRESSKKPLPIADLLPLGLQKFSGEERVEVAQEFISAGAAGVGLNEALASLIEEIVRTCHSQSPPATSQQLLNIILNSPASVDYDGGVLLKDAFAAHNIWLIRQLCLKQPDQVTLAATLDLLAHDSTWSTPGISVDAVEPLLRCYPNSVALSKALLDVINQAPLYGKMISKLLEYQADVCWQRGVIIQRAITNCDTDTFRMLVESISRVEIVDLYFYESLANLEKAKMLLHKHRSQQTLDEALASELKSTAVRQNVAEFLLENNASMDHDGGVGFQEVCQREEIAVLNIIKDYGSKTIRGKALCSTIERGVSERVQISRMLLSSGCSSNAVDDALVLAVTKEKQAGAIHSATSRRDSHADDRLELTKLLLQCQANVNHGQGAALKGSIDNSAWQVLDEMLRHKVDAIVLDYTYSYARSTLKMDGSRYMAYKTILDATPSKPVDLDDALVDIAIGCSQHEQLWQLLLTRGASVNHRRGQAIMATIDHRNYEYLPMLLRYRPSTEILNNALASALKHDVATRYQPIKLILEAGASGDVLDYAINTVVFENDEQLLTLLLQHQRTLGLKAAYAVHTAAVAGNAQQLCALLACVDNTSVVTGAFGAMIEQRTAENVSSGIECALLLLEKGVDLDTTNMAMKSYIENCGRSEPDQAYIAKLLQHGADVNAFHGRCLHAAVESHHRDVFILLASHGATSDTLTQVMPQIFLKEMPEEDIVEIFDAIIGQRTKPNVNEASNQDSLTYLALYHYPDSDRILQMLLRCGYKVDWEVTISINSAIGDEKGNALLWAITGERSRRITMDVLRTLLDAAVDVDYTTRRSLVTPLMVAASNGNVALVNLLLEHNPEVDLIDHLRWTAQTYASENGHLEIVQRLAERGCKKYDGSLHEAARQLHHKIVRYLISQGHDVDDPCTLHEGRSALQELLLKTQILTSDKRPALEKTLKALFDAGADSTLECRSNGDKNALYCALDNPNPYTILEAFLATGQWKYLDERYNWYTDSNGTAYSATMYVERGPW